MRGDQHFFRGLQIGRLWPLPCPVQERQEQRVHQVFRLAHRDMDRLRRLRLWVDDNLARVFPE